MFSNKIPLMVLIGVVLAGVVWYSFLRDKGSGTLLLTEDLTRATESDRDVVNVLLQLRTVSLSGTIFTDPAFMALQDFSNQIVPEPVGRPNPFAPLGSSAATKTATGTPKLPAR